MHTPPKNQKTIAVIGFQHETNSFDVNPTMLNAFITPSGWPGLTEGAELFAAMKERNLALAGFIERAQELDYPIVPILWANAPPGGLVSDAAFDHIMQLMTRRLRQALTEQPLHAVYLDLHGAMMTERNFDAESMILRQIRQVIGKEPLLIASLDWHANVTPDMVEAADWLTIYRTYPHIDMHETGARLASRLSHIQRPIARHFRAVPYVIPLTAQSSLANPMARLLAERAALAPDHQTELELGLAAGFPPADMPDMGPSIFCYGCGENANGNAVENAAAKMFDLVMAAISDFATEKIYTMDEILTEATHHAALANRPLVIADTQDNPGAGASSDTNFLLNAVLSYRKTFVSNSSVAPSNLPPSFARIGFALYADKDAAAFAHLHKIGDEVRVTLGGKSGVQGDAPIILNVRVGALWEGEFTATGQMWGGGVLNLGQMARLDVLELGQDLGISIFVSSIRQQPTSLAIFEKLGSDATQFSLLVLKSSVHFRADWQDRAARILVVAAPDFYHGTNLANPRYFKYRYYKGFLEKV
ncbi:MAG: M81 family metallopeptidase [Alphaproteobacteria bacterium]|nr:M81 family metallopeptidase [Alphaproteobacteria bacterium]